MVIYMFKFSSVESKNIFYLLEVLILYVLKYNQSTNSYGAVSLCSVIMRTF